jgi:putative membrane protein
MSQATHPRDRVFVPLIVGLSVVVPIAVALLFLLVGFGMIKTKNVAAHRLANLSAFTLSAVFLVSYVVSHLSNPDAKFGGEGWIRPVYFFILISHIVLSVPVLPMAMFSIYRALNNQIAAHKRWVKWTFPIWLYVAVTGVLVYVFMAPYYPH